MKKSLFFVATAALVLASCSNDVKIDENTALEGSNAQKEIAFTPFAQNAKRTPSRDNHGYINGTVFSQDWYMMVSAVDVADNTNPFFGATEFLYDGANYWKGNPAKYWPLSPVQVNFLAIAHASSNDTTGVAWTTTTTDHKVVVTMTDNYAKTEQRDLIYAIGNGQVTQNGNTLTFPSKVDMTFKHTQAYMVFRVKAADAASDSITIKDIQIKNALTKGKATIARTNPGTYADGNVSLLWSDTAVHAEYSTVTPEQGEIAQRLDHSKFTEVGHLLVIPKMNGANTFVNGAFEDFKINYALDGKDYEYTYTPAATATKLEAGKKYIYEITFKLHEILVDPKVTDWDSTDNRTSIYIPSIVYNETANVSIGATAGYYTFTISNVPAAGGSTYSFEEGDATPAGDNLDFIDGDVDIVANTTASAVGYITLKFKSTGGDDGKKHLLKLKKDGVVVMTITLNLSSTAVD